MPFITEVTNCNDVTFKLGDSCQDFDGNTFIVISIRTPVQKGVVKIGVVKCGTEAFRWLPMGHFTHLNGTKIR